MKILKFANSIHRKYFTVLASDEFKTQTAPIDNSDSTLDYERVFEPDIKEDLLRNQKELKENFSLLIGKKMSFAQVEEYFKSLDFNFRNDAVIENIYEPASKILYMPRFNMFLTPNKTINGQSLAEYLTKTNFFIDIKNEHFIPPKMGVPGMYIVHFKNLKEVATEENKNPNTVHWIHPILRDLIGVHDLAYNYIQDNDDYNPKIAIDNFIKTNIDKIQEIQSHFERLPRKLGQGSNAIAYDIGEFLVLRLFSDEADFSKQVAIQNAILDRKISSKTELVVKEIGELGKIETPDDGMKSLYYMISPKLKLISKDREQRDFLNSMYKNTLAPWVETNFREFLGEDKDSELDSSSKNMQAAFRKFNSLLPSLLKSVKSEYGDKISKFTNDFKMANDWLPVFIKEIVTKYITNRGDLHVSNSGITYNGYLRYFDSYHSYYTNKLNTLN